MKLLLTVLCFLVALSGFAQTNSVAKRLPPHGIAVPGDVRSSLSNRLEVFSQTLRALESDDALFPDVAIFQKAVEWALRFDEFYKTNEFKVAEQLVEAGLRRAQELTEGKPSWTGATGLVVRAYRSRIDDSLQPYGLVLPSGYEAGSRERWRLDCWFHGRDEKLTELSFLNDRMKKAGEFAPTNAIVLHLYGRYCNASKFAGETDLFEALQHVQQNYRIDTNRITVRGFSMGGASVWHLATHHAGRWAAAAPGAGFAETPNYLKLKVTPDSPPWWEQKLWHLYNSTDYAGNLFHCPTIAYSGEIDKQKQAADTMASAMKAYGLDLKHVIGPGTEHKYHPDAKKEIEAWLGDAVRLGRKPLPPEIRFTTYTLRYNSLAWLTVEALEKHWEKSTVQARLLTSGIEARTTNASALSFSFAQHPFDDSGARTYALNIDGQVLRPLPVEPGGRLAFTVRKENEKWVIATRPLGGLRKVHGLQGPIDDAFMDRFLIVLPTGKSSHVEVDRWVARESQRAIEQWRGVFRGEPQVKRDTDVTPQDIEESNLILWGDPRSNSQIGKMAEQLPIRWTAQEISGVASNSFPSSTRAVVMIYPNPLNAKRYVVLNSGFTFRGFGSNADQTPKLPDWAVIDITQPATDKAPGGVSAAGFFDEQWKVVKR